MSTTIEAQSVPSGTNGAVEIDEHALAELRALDELDAATIIDERVRYIETATRRHFVETGLLVLEMEERQLWRKLSPPGQLVYFHSFGAWMMDAIPASRRTAYACARILRELKNTVALDDLREMPRMNAEKLVALSTAAQRDPQLINAAKVLTEEAFIEKINELHPDQHVEPTKTAVMKQTVTERSLFDEAIDNSMWVYEVKSREDALANIVAYYMDGTCEREGYIQYTNRDAYDAFRDRQAK